MSLENLEHVVVHVAGRRENVAVNLQQVSAQLFREVRLKRLRIVTLAHVAFVDRLSWMEVRR